MHEGTQIGTQTNVSSSGGYVYSYNTPTYNPICKKPKTEEEKVAVVDLLPIAKEKQSQKNKELSLAYIGLFGLLFIVYLGIPKKGSYY